MISKLKCPVCQQELHKDPDGYYSCCTDNCSVMNAGGNGASGTESLWTALIQAKQDLEITTKAADNSREKLAAFMHDTWGNWFAYQLNNSTVENLQRWVIQSNTPYSSLTETDKDKDRKFADKIIEIIKEQIDHIADVSKMIEHKEQ